MKAWWRAVLIAALGAGPVLTGPALAADSSEFWPQASAFVGLDEGTRLYFDGSIARGKESTLRTLDLSAFVDLSIQPILREDLRTDDWQRARYLWARLGYTHVGKVDEGKGETTENRGVLSIYAKAPLPAEVWIEGRARVDLRWLGDDFSTRYRLRFDLTRKFTLLEHTVVPYVNGEAFYDTRYAASAGCCTRSAPRSRSARGSATRSTSAGWRIACRARARCSRWGPWPSGTSDCVATAA